jgi:hypothetical protein
MVLPYRVNIPSLAELIKLIAMSRWIFIAKLQSFNRPVYGRNITSKISPALYRMELYRMSWLYIINILVNFRMNMFIFMFSESSQMANDYVIQV